MDRSSQRRSSHARASVPLPPPRHTARARKPTTLPTLLLRSSTARPSHLASHCALALQATAFPRLFPPPLPHLPSARSRPHHEHAQALCRPVALPRAASPSWPRHRSHPWCVVAVHRCAVPTTRSSPISTPTSHAREPLGRVGPTASLRCPSRAPRCSKASPPLSRFTSAAVTPWPPACVHGRRAVGRLGPCHRRPRAWPGPRLPLCRLVAVPPTGIGRAAVLCACSVLRERR